MNTASKINFRFTTRKQVRGVWDTPLLAAGFFIDDEHILIFHAMKLRESFKRQLEL
jgi:hypothetical protein